MLFSFTSLNEYKLPNIRNYITVSQTLPPVALNRELWVWETFTQGTFIVPLPCARQTDYDLVGYTGNTEIGNYCVCNKGCDRGSTDTE